MLHAAAFVTKQTDAIAVVVSQTTGGVSVIGKGRILITFSPKRTTAYGRE